MSHISKLTHENVFKDVWASLYKGVTRGAHAFHTPVLASVWREKPDARTVVLRHADEEQRQLICHTDVRSPKVSMLRKNPQVAWLFYDREAKVQLRMYGQAKLHHADRVAEKRWETCSQSSRRCYLAPVAPGLDLATADSRSVDRTDGFENFAVVSCDVSEIDWLFLQAKRHLRAHFSWSRGQWSAKWVAP